jgi:hypothetical protein
VIDLHTHTTASDGRSTPEALVREAAAAGVRTLAVTDHDTMASTAIVAAAAEAAGLSTIPGIEITAVGDGHDVHVLGYFLDPQHDELDAFLSNQRADRRRRLEEMVAALARLGVPIDASFLERSASPASGKALGRPLVARALVAAGHARDIADAFDRFLSEGRPAFIARRGASPAEVVRLIARARGLAAIAHPGKLKRDAVVAAMIDAGMPAIEVHHPDHDANDVARYAAIARQHGLAVTGGSDYHGADSGRVNSLGRVGLTADQFSALTSLAEARAR